MKAESFSSGLITKNLGELNEKSAMSSRIDAFGRVIDKVGKEHTAIFKMTASKTGERAGGKIARENVDFMAKADGIGIKRIVAILFEKQRGFADRFDDGFGKQHAVRPF